MARFKYWKPLLISFIINVYLHFLKPVSGLYQEQCIKYQGILEKSLRFIVPVKEQLYLFRSDWMEKETNNVNPTALRLPISAINSTRLDLSQANEVEWESEWPEVGQMVANWNRTVLAQILSLHDMDGEYLLLVAHPDKVKGSKYSNRPEVGMYSLQYKKTKLNNVTGKGMFNSNVVMFSIQNSTRVVMYKPEDPKLSRGEWYFAQQNVWSQSYELDYGIIFENEEYGMPNGRRLTFYPNRKEVKFTNDNSATVIYPWENEGRIVAGWSTGSNVYLLYRNSTASQVHTWPHKIFLQPSQSHYGIQVEYQQFTAFFACDASGHPPQHEPSTSKPKKPIKTSPKPFKPADEQEPSESSNLLLWFMVIGVLVLVICGYLYCSGRICSSRNDIKYRKGNKRVKRGQKRAKGKNRQLKGSKKKTVSRTSKTTKQRSARAKKQPLSSTTGSAGGGSVEGSGSSPRRTPSSSTGASVTRTKSLVKSRLSAVSKTGQMDFDEGEMGNLAQGAIVDS